jgi:large conductance mechanosensitive channel
MGMIQEFKAFAMRGNVVDLAVGVIIGGAFGKIINSVIEDLIMPVVGKAIGNVDFSNLYVPLSDKITAGMALADAKKLGPVLAYGNFLTILINFLILAFCIFMVVKGMNAMKHAEAAKPTPPPEPTASEKLLVEIRDLLKKH